MAQTKLLKGTFKILVQTNCPDNKIAGFNKEKNAWRLEIKAKPEHNKILSTPENYEFLVQKS